MNLCAVIPVYDHEEAIDAVVNAVLAQGLPCILVDDGSSVLCARTLDRIVRAAPDKVTLLRHPHNQGKGAAVVSGMRHAAASGYSHALQIDADGQHASTDIPRFIAAATAHPQAVIAGCPQYDDSVPGLRFYARYLTHVWVWINTLSFAIRDSMCGFRLYPLPAFMRLAEQHRIGRHMDFDTDVLVRLYWDGLEVINLPTRVVYPTDGVSHFRMVRDNVLITCMHSRLFFGMLRRFPQLLIRTLSRTKGAP
ncbi:glycosyltransferase family 2 protein [Herbaspirillum sp. RTI4]|uniref:glycosyltransferase family 2 protein n=1 Tax=Herbaspirillum sp. RTI4 TaxID=3048640 RepID=UPI002AB4D9C0|nr:glycosyltransferase family 2 protein [Herbaspirillum sp. RTI4]MDY7578930.1 glycosyltransferase family 2 protein [Herbaspirillum sp. RTI4]MEA9982019.1 glycosyltransferase family 2 protein [Herbaspirillum sp. RTI4]